MNTPFSACIASFEKCGAGFVFTLESGAQETIDLCGSKIQTCGNPANGDFSITDTHGQQYDFESDQNPSGFTIEEAIACKKLCVGGSGDSTSIETIQTLLEEIQACFEQLKAQCTPVDTGCIFVDGDFCGDSVFFCPNEPDKLFHFVNGILTLYEGSMDDIGKPGNRDLISEKMKLPFEFSGIDAEQLDLTMDDLVANALVGGATWADGTDVDPAAATTKFCGGSVRVATCEQKVLLNDGTKVTPTSQDCTGVHKPEGTANAVEYSGEASFELGSDGDDLVGVKLGGVIYGCIYLQQFTDEKTGEVVDPDAKV